MAAKVFEKNDSNAPQEQVKSTKPTDLGYSYKFLCFEAKFLDKFLNWKFLFVTLCISIFLENLLTTGVATVILSTIEKEFYLTSTESGFFLAVYEIGAFLSAPVFGFYGSLPRVNKMRIISISFFIVAAGAYLAFVVIFLKQPNNPDLPYSGSLNSSANTSNSPTSAANYGTCLLSTNNGSSESNCQLNRDPSRNPKYIPNLQYMLFAGHFVIGLGSVAMYTVGVAFIEEIVNPDVSSYCQAIYFGLGSIGGGVGLLITGQMLNMNARIFIKGYVTPFMNPKRAGWIGAWWMPYLVYGSMCLFLGMFTFGFKKRRGQNVEVFTVNDKTVTETADSRKNCCANLKRSLSFFRKNFTEQLKRVWKNKPLVFMIITTATEGILLKGFLGFMSHYFEFQFSLSASTSTLITGGIALVSVIAGTLTGAYIINRWKWTSKQCSMFCFIVFFITSFAFFILLNHCEETQFVNGISNAQELSTNPDRPCPNCNCVNLYNPVCIVSNSSAFSKLVYQSPCHAGCIQALSSSSFTSCECLSLESNVDPGLVTNSSQLVLSTESCENGIRCIKNLIINCFAALLIVFLTAVTVIPLLKAILGSVEFEFQAFALGVRAAFVRIIGNSAGSIIVGQAVDLTCKYWQQNCYNVHQKMCQIYSNKRMSLALSLIGFICRFLSAFFILMACVCIFKREKNPANSDSLNNISLNESPDQAGRAKSALQHNLSSDNLTVTSNLSVNPTSLLSWTPIPDSPSPPSK